LSKTEQEFLEILSLLLFGDKDKIGDFEMLIFFLMGYPISIMETLLGAIDANFDISEYIRSGEYRREINASGDLQQRLSAEDSHKMDITPQTIYTVLSIVQTILRLIVMATNDEDSDEEETEGKSSKIEMVLPYFYLMRGVAKNFDMLFDLETSKKIQKTFSLFSFLFRFGGEVMLANHPIDAEGDKPPIGKDDISVWLGVGCEVTVEVMEILDAYAYRKGIDCSKDENDIKCLKFLNALLGLTRALMLIYIEPNKHAFEKGKHKEEELLKDAPELVMAMMFRGLFIAFSFDIDLEIYIEENT
jgi:hypothetical protein